eukprot:jgi/Chrzof1/1175/Cz01g43150.t1
MPTVLLVSLDEDSFFDEIYAPFLSLLRDRCTVKVAKNVSAASSHLSTTSAKPAAVLVTDGDIANKTCKDLRGALAEYARHGGTIIFCGLFSCELEMDVIDRFFKDSFGPPWTHGEYLRTTFALNPSATAPFVVNCPNHTA